MTGGDGIFTDRTLVADTARPPEDVALVSSIHGHAMESSRCVGDFDGEYTAALATDGTGNGPGARPLGLIAASHNRDPPLDPYASGYAAHSRRNVSHALTATVAAAAGDAYHIASNAAGGVRAVPNAASADGTVPATASVSTGEGDDAPIAIIGDAATTTDYITDFQATPAVRYDITRGASAEEGPPVDRDATLDTGGGASARNVTAVTVQTGATAATKGSPTTPGAALEGRSSGSAPIPYSPPLPPQTV